ncbi:MAG: FecR family protein [Leptospira sp.]|nr:FecR family protein [Leptospira sp.]
MKQNYDSKLILKLEAALRKTSAITNAQNFPTWEELSTRQIKHPELYEVQKKHNNLVFFPFRPKTVIATGLLAAASLSIVFILNRHSLSQSHESIAMPSEASVRREVIAEDLLGLVSQTKGKNFIFSKENESAKAAVQKGTTVKSGDHLLVGNGSQLDLQFPNKAWVRIGQGTEIELVDSKTTSYSTKQLIRIIKGKVLVAIGKLQKDSSFQIASGDLETSVRGTTFSVSFDGKNSQSVALRDGSLSIQQKGEVETVLEPGKRYERTEKQTPTLTTLDPKDDKELKALQTQVTLTREALLYETYSRLELVRMEDGTEHRGVIRGQSATHLQIETVDGNLEIPIGKILETEKIR